MQPGLWTVVCSQPAEHGGDGRPGVTEQTAGLSVEVNAAVRVPECASRRPPARLFIVRRAAPGFDVLGVALAVLAAVMLFGTTHAAPGAQPRAAATYLPTPEDDFDPELGGPWRVTDLRAVVFDAWRRYEDHDGVLVEYRVHVDDNERPAQAWGIGLMNDLIRQEGWRVRPDASFGEHGY